MATLINSCWVVGLFVRGEPHCAKTRKRDQKEEEGGDQDLGKQVVEGKDVELADALGDLVLIAVDGKLFDEHCKLAHKTLARFWETDRENDRSSQGNVRFDGSKNVRKMRGTNEDLRGPRCARGSRQRTELG